MAKCAKTGSGCCTCGIKKKRKATARRPPPAPVYKGVSVNVLGGTEQQYVNNLMAYLQNLNRPQVAQNVGLAVPVKPVMVSGGTQTAVGTSTGITQTVSPTTTGGTQTAVGTSTSETQTARQDKYKAGFLNILDRLEKPMPRNMAATLAAQVPLPPSPPASVVGTEERTFGTQTEPTGSGARAVNKFMNALKPAIIAQRARQTATGETQTTLQTATGETQTTLQAAIGETQTEAPAARTYGTQTYGMQVLRRPTPATTVAEVQADIAPPRRGNYPAGFYNILPTIIPPAALAAQVRDIGVMQGYRQGRGRGEAIGALAGAEEAVGNLTFTQRTGARGTETFTVPELQQRFAEGQILRLPGGRPRLQAVADAAGGGGGGGGAARVEAVAEEAAPK
jgi:hypothetical protein